MLKNYIKLAFRSFWNRKLTTAINIFGLSFGIACASIAFIFIQHEWSFDKFHEEAEKIHWFYVNIDDNFNVSGTPGPFAPALEENFPEVTETVRLNKQNIFVKSGVETYKEKVLLVDPNFFSFFNFPLAAGDKKSALDQMNSIVLSEEMARKYFGRKDPVGETLPVTFKEEETLFKVTAVAKKAPSNSSIQFDFLLPIQFAYKDDLAALNSNWSSFSVGTFIRFQEMEDIEKLSQKLATFIDDKFESENEEDDSKYTFIMTNFNDYHLKNDMRINGVNRPGEMRYVKILAIIAFLILFVACLNFMNLSNAQSSQRLKEVGVRQVLGARPRQLMIQFLSESLVISYLSLLVGLLLIALFIPFTNSIFDYPLEVNWTQPKIILSLLGIALFTGLLAGSYPSFLLSKLSAVKTFKSNFKIGGNNWITKGSLVFQFALSIGLLVCTGIMYQQQQFISERNLGFDKEEIVVIPTQVRYSDKFDTGRFVEQYRTELQNYEGIRQVAGVSNSFNRGNRVRFVEKEDGAEEVVYEYRVDPEYVEVLNISLVEGRNFSKDIQGDLENAVIVNEAFLKKYEVGEISSFQFPTSFGEEYTATKIIGVAKDYHFNHLRTTIKPMFLTMNPEFHFEHMLVKIKPDNVQNTLAQLKNTWQKTRLDKPFEFYFLDEDLQKQYTEETRWSTVLTGASILAVLISMLGLFGLLALVLAQRTKEISIRKILGAGLGNIVGLLSKDFIMLIGVALVIASPIAWYYMNGWLESFAYRIDIKWWNFVLTGVFILGVALITISFQVIKAALTNPAENLKTD